MPPYCIKHGKYFTGDPLACPECVQPDPTAKQKEANEVAHVVMLHRKDGSSIAGILRCVNCGLSETYWQRFPNCDVATTPQPAQQSEGVTGLLMKYFTLKPSGTDLYAQASRRAMRTYAAMIEPDNPQFAKDLRQWADREFARAVENGMHAELSDRWGA